MGRFKIQFLLEDNTWSTRYNLPKTDRSSDTSNDWTPVSSKFTGESCDIKIIYDEIGSAHADMCFSNTTITHSVYYMNYETSLKDMFKSIPVYRKILLISFVIKNDSDLLNECGFLENDNNRLNDEFKFF